MEFFLVYIREAHPIDGDRPSTRFLIEQPVTDSERKAVATTCIANLDLGGMPALLDGIDDKTNHAYAAHPDRLYLVGKDGKIAYAGQQGPRGFKPQELKEAIVVELAKKPSGSPAAARTAAGRGGEPSDRRRAAGNRSRPGGGGPMSRIPLIRALDSDQDGELSAREIENAVAALTRLDKDDNGKLTADEMLPDFARRGGSFGGSRSGGGRRFPGNGTDRPRRPGADN